jgi:adenosylcobinamide amidohydrolase
VLDLLGSPDLITRPEDGRDLPMLVWRCSGPVRAIASGVLGGGLGEVRWIINASVSAAYDRRDPDRHLAELARGLDLDGPGAGLLTAVDTASAVTHTDAGVTAVATVGLGHPTWAAAPDNHLRHGYRPGTVNIVAWIPVPLSDAALVNAVVTATEAKAQALWEAGVAATGTASDALVIACPPGPDPEPYGGPRSAWGARLARAVHAAVGRGLARPADRPAGDKDRNGGTSLPPPAR